jgi:hypothetical protein
MYGNTPAGGIKGNISITGISGDMPNYGGKG